MTILDFSNEFDLLYNNLMTDMAPEINMYEKSMLLTMAQEAVVKELYLNYETTELARRAINPLVENDKIDLAKKGEDGNIIDLVPVANESRGFLRYEVTLPKNLWYIVRERAKVISSNWCDNQKVIMVSPERHDDFLRDLENPFRGPGRTRVFRLDAGAKRENADEDPTEFVHLVTKYRLDLYDLTYIRRPKPIILTDLSEYPYSDNESVATIHVRGYVLNSAGKEDLGYDVKDMMSNPCELSETIQAEILNRAVLMAQMAYKHDGIPAQGPQQPPQQQQQ